MVILSLETASSACSVALHSDGVVKDISHTNIPQSASSKLALMIDELLKRSDITPKELDAIAVSAGPGSYTGLRIGVATAKGLCFALNIPLIAVNTLESMVRQISHQFSENALLCPMLDARRMEVYCLLSDKNGKQLERTQAKVIDESSFTDVLANNKIIFFGNGAAKCQELIKSDNAIFVTDIIPSAEEIGVCANEKAKMKQFENLADFEPYYLKDFLIKKPKSVA